MVSVLKSHSMVGTWQGVARHRLCQREPCGALRLPPRPERVRAPCWEDGPWRVGQRQGVRVRGGEAGVPGQEGDGEEHEGAPAARRALRIAIHACLSTA